MPRLLFSFLGPPKIVLDGRSVQLDTRKAIALLAYLAVTGEGQSRDSLVTLLWGRYGRVQGQAALRRTLSTIRAMLGAHWLQSTRDLIALEPSAELWIDVRRVRQLIAECDSHGHGNLGICRSCIRLLNEASRLFRGEFLAGFTLRDSLAFDDWQFFVSEDLRLQWQRVLDRLARCQEAAGDHSAALGVMRLRLSQDPLDESAHVELMRLYAWLGNRSAALRQFEECGRILRTELDTPVRASTERLYEAIKRGQIPKPPVFDTAPLTLTSKQESSGGAPESPANGPPPASPGFAPDRTPPDGVPSLVTALVVRSTARGASAGRRAAAPIDETTARSVAEVIARYHGEVAEVAKERVVAWFSDQTLLESNPELAVRASLELAATAARSRTEMAVCVTTFSRESARAAFARDSSPDVKAVASAALLASRSRSDRVLADEHTFRLTRDLFSFEPAEGEHAAARHGRTFYRVLGVREPGRKSRGFAGKRPPLIGRDEEARRLREVFDQTIGGCGGVVMISGEAGIGKSRLVEELRIFADRSGAWTKIRWLEGRCLAPSISIGYWPFVDLLRAVAPSHAQEGADDASPLAALLNELAGEGFLSESELRLVRPTITNLLSAPRGGLETIDPPLPPEHVKRGTFFALSSLFCAMAKQRPLVLVFEDLHWADDISLEVIDFLLDSLAALPVLIVCVFRPDPSSKCRHLPSSAARRRGRDLAEIHLREITREASERLLDDLLPADVLSRPVRDHILESAQGNPYFLEELVRAFADGELSLENEVGARGRSAARPAEPSIPEGIKRVVLSRFFALPEFSQQLLSCASVIGRIFSKRLLELAMGSEELLPVLEELEDRELLFVERTVPETEYSFNHVLTQEAIYDALPETERAELHRRAAGAYERLATEGSDDYCEQLAFHCDRGSQTAKAIELYYRAGEKACSAFAHEAAIANLSRGLKLLREAKGIENPLSRELDFLIALGIPLVLARGHQSPEVEASYLRAKAICEQIGTPRQFFQVTLGLRRLYFSRGEHRRERELAHQLLEVGRREHDAVLVSRAHMMLAETLFALGDFPALLEHAQCGLDLYEPRDSRIHLLQFGNDTGVGCSVCLAGAQWALGLPDQALRTAVSNVDRARELAHLFTLVFALHNAALVAYFRNDVERARRWSEEVVKIAVAEDFTLYRAFGPSVYGWALGMQGDEERGIELMTEALGKQPPFLPFRPLFTCMLAEVFRKMGRLTEAVSAINDGLAVARSSDAHLWEPELNRLRGEIGAQLGESITDVEPWLLRSLRLARRQHAKSLELRSLVSLLRLAPLRDARRSELDALVRSFTEGGDTPDLEEARSLLAADRP